MAVSEADAEGESGGGKARWSDARCQGGWADRGTATEQSTSFHPHPSLSGPAPPLPAAPMGPSPPPLSLPCWSAAINGMNRPWASYLGRGGSGETWAKPSLSHGEMGAPPGAGLQRPWALCLYTRVYRSLQPRWERPQLPPAICLHLARGGGLSAPGQLLSEQRGALGAMPPGRLWAQSGWDRTCSRLSPWLPDTGQTV